MGIKSLNSIGGVSVGLNPVNVILANGDVNTTGNVTGQYIIGNGAFLTNLNTAVISNGISNVNIPVANGNVNISVNGNSNVLAVTGVGANIAGTLRVTGNTTVGNLVAGSLNTTDSVNLSGILTVGSFGVTIPLGGLFVTPPSVLGAVRTGNANVANLITAGLISAAGNVTGQYIIGNGAFLTGIQTGSNISNGTSNVSISTSGGNVTTSVAGNANVLVVTGTGVNVAGTLNATGNASVGNVQATNGTLTGNLSLGAGTGGSLTGANLVSANYITGSLTTSAQPNITSVGTLGSLSVSGNANVGNVGANVLVVTGTSNLNSVSNITITGGSNNQFLRTNGNGVLTWSTSGVPTGGNIGSVLVKASNTTFDTAWVPQSAITLYETNPVFTYNSVQQVTRIDYASGNYKLFTYNILGQLTRLDYIRGVLTIRKDFTYNPDGTLNNIVQTEF